MNNKHIGSNFDNFLKEEDLIMTIDIERQFFETFNIAKRQVDCDQPARIYCSESGCKTCKYSVYEYPEISDRILLELICINAKSQDMYQDYYRLRSRDYNNLKIEILGDCICEREDIKHQVQSLFKEV